MSSHRLHDFVELGQRIFSAAGLEPSQFGGLMDAMRREQGAEIAAGDSFITTAKLTLRAMLKSAPGSDALPGYKSWFQAGHAAVRLEAGGAIVGVRPRNLVGRLAASPTTGGDWLPRNERELSGALLRTTPIFSDIGIAVGRREPSKGNTFWEFRFSPEAVSELHGYDE
jgi:hypothetical protein